MYYSKQNTAQLLLNYYRFDHVYRSSLQYNKTHKFAFSCVIMKLEPNTRTFAFGIRESIISSHESFPVQGELLTRPNCKKTILSEIWEKLPDEVSQWYAQYDSDGNYFAIIPPHKYIIENKMNDIDGLVTFDEYSNHFQETIRAWEEGIQSLKDEWISTYKWDVQLKTTGLHSDADGYSKLFEIDVKVPYPPLFVEPID
jgi:hypothetical protein